MANQSFTSPVGRFVQGDAFEAQTTDMQGAPLTIKTGPNKGQPTKRWFMAVAYPKSDPAVLPYLQRFGEIARVSWPAHFAAYNPASPPLFGCTHHKMSLKIMDGDGVDDNGKPNKDKDGFAGHWIVKYSTSIQAPEVYHVGKYDPIERVTDARELPRGFYVRIFASADNNQNDQRPGIYVNLSKVEIVRPGVVIVSGPSAADAFGGAPPAAAGPTPPTPPAPAPAGGLIATGKDGHTVEGLRAAGWTDDQMVSGGYATRPAAAPTPPVPPTPPAPPAPPAPPTPPAPPYDGYMQVDPNGPPAGFKMGPAAGAHTYKSFTDAGWTQDALVTAGMILPQ